MIRVNAIMRLDELPVASKITTTRSVVTAMTGNPNFTTPNPALTVITAANNALETAYIAAMQGGPDDKANMRAKEIALDIQLRLLMAYVTAIASANPITAEAVILSAGMEKKGHSTRSSSPFSVDPLKEAGKIKIAVKFVSRATFAFQVNTDPRNESGWQTIYEGTRSKFVMSGLTSGTRYYFRASVIDKNGRGPWTEPLSSIAL